MSKSVIYDKDKSKKTKIKIPEEIKEPLEEPLQNDELLRIKQDAMGDDTIKSYFPKALVITYDLLKNYNYIEDLLPNIDSYVFILYCSAPSSGHWTILSRDNKIIEYFDSYGGNPDAPLHWINMQKRKELGEEIPYLTNMLNKTKLKVVYNPIDYQSKKNDIATCGRHCCFRLQCKMYHNMNLNKYYDFMRQLKDEYDISYDDIVSENISQL